MLNFEDFYAQNWKRSVNFAVSKKLSVQDAEDVSQNSLIEFKNKIDSGKVNPNDNIEGYYYNILRWRIKDKFDSLKVLAKYFESSQLVPQYKNIGFSPPEDRQTDLIKLAVQRVKNSNRGLNFKLFYETVINNKSDETICAEFKVKKETIFVARSRILKKVVEEAKKLKKKGID